MSSPNANANASSDPDPDQDQIEDEYRNRNLRPTVTPSQSQTQTPSRQANDNENEIEEVHEVVSNLSTKPKNKQGLNTAWSFMRCSTSSSSSSFASTSAAAAGQNKRSAAQASTLASDDTDKINQQTCEPDVDDASCTSAKKIKKSKSNKHYCLLCLADTNKPLSKCGIHRGNNSSMLRHRKNQHNSQTNVQFAHHASLVVQRLLKHRHVEAEAEAEAEDEDEYDAEADARDCVNITMDMDIAEASDNDNVAVAAEADVATATATATATTTTTISGEAASNSILHVSVTSTGMEAHPVMSTAIMNTGASAAQASGLLLSPDLAQSVLQALSEQSQMLAAHVKDFKQLSESVKILSDKFSTSSKQLPVDKEYEKISQTENMAQLLKSPSIGIEAIGEDFIVYCKCCFDVLSKAQPMPTNYSVADAFRFLNPGLGPNSISKGKFCSGRLVKAAEMKELHESPTAFSKFRYSVKSHFSGVNGMGHAKAKKKVDNDKGRLTRNQKVVRNLVRSAAYHIESACAAMHYELTIVLLSESGAEVGNIGHGFQFGRQLWDLLEFCVDRDASRFMREPLPSTGLPPMMCLTCDKSTPTRTTNQAVLILLRDSTGVALAIPAGAPPIYNESMEAGGTALAKLLFQTLRNMDPPLRSIVGVVADGQYIANGNFLSEVRMQLGVDADSESDLPISWDAAHYLNLAVTDVRDARNKEFFRRFVVRANLFSHHFGRGRGFAALE
ncbi:hypothetical protein BOX15_Mlig015360g1 [Macrostomum lignano]|uniref:Uncharacterized protein n=1 Tax=Macrostomum lignano TaxID=282301 RepID=A0A267F744_9PLAT|nr:hypothetical protein BOX15_Mlig015360g1 [Macrostomum lignano]